MRRSLPLLLLVLVSCVAAPPQPAPAVTPRAPQFAATVTAQRVVLLSFDGLGADALARQQNLPAFERLAHEGMTARVRNVEPTLTAPSHVAIITGATPQRTGVVSNRFHLAGHPIEETARGMMQDSDVETIVAAARRQGKRVGVVSYPTIDNQTPNRTADFGLVWTAPLVAPRMVTLKASDFKKEWVPPTWSERPQQQRSYSPVQRARIAWGFRLDVFIVAYDTTDDARTNYDLYLVEAGDREITPDAKGWFAVSAQTDDGLRGSWSKFLATSPALDVQLYWGGISRNQSWPDSFRELLDTEAGFWPGAPEEELPAGTDTFIEMNDRLADFYTRAQMLAIERMPFDLLLTYHSALDGAAHKFLGTPESDRVQRAAFLAADRAVAAFAEALQPDDALVVTGDHGLVVATREVRINTLLAERGFAPRWHAYTSGAHAQIYRFGGEDDSDAVVALLQSTGLFERIEKKTAASHPRSGDIMATALPDVAVVQESRSPSMVDPAPPRGQHGGLNTHRELNPPFFAIGKGVRAGDVGEIAQTKIARVVASLLGITPPATAD